MPDFLGDIGDRSDEPRSLGERPDAVVGIRTPVEDTPVIDSSDVVEFPGCGSLIGVDAPSADLGR